MTSHGSTLIKDHTHKIIIQQKFHQPIRKKLNHIQDIIETELFKTEVNAMKKSIIDRCNTYANIKRVRDLIYADLETQV